MKSIQQFLQKPWLYIFIVLFGISLKFYHLNYRFFWYDEICTIQHTSGIELYKYDNMIPINEIANIKEYKSLIHLTSLNQSIGSQLKGLFTSTNLTPGHYPFLMIWYRIVGDEPLDYRLFSVFVFVLTLPFLFLLAKNMFESDHAGWIAISLFSVSPMFQYYAQEARYMILMTFFIIVLHYLFLKASQINKKKWWVGYCIIGALSLYTSVLSGIVVTGHLIYVWIFNRENGVKLSIPALIILFIYLPWIVTMLKNNDEILFALSWQTQILSDQSLLDPIIQQMAGFNKTFNYIGANAGLRALFIEHKYLDFIPKIMMEVIGITVIIISIVYSLKRLPRKISYFLVLIFIPPIIFFYIVDMARNSCTSILWRYHTITFSTLILFMTFWLSNKMLKARISYALVFIGLISIGITSILEITKGRFFWVFGCETAANSAILFSKAHSPLVITDYSVGSYRGVGGFIMVLNECNSETIDILPVSPDTEDIDSLISGTEYSEIYVAYASPKLVSNCKSQFGERMDSLEIEGISPMWQIKSANPEQ